MMGAEQSPPTLTEPERVVPWWTAKSSAPAQLPPIEMVPAQLPITWMYSLGSGGA
jgi:hypothetical protein